MNPDQFLDELRADRDRIAALAGIDPGLAVPTCGEWMAADLLAHLGRVHRWAAGNVFTEAGDALEPFPPRPAPGTDLLAWVVEGLDELLLLFGGTELDADCATFVGIRRREWWLRRQTLETSVHRWDLQAAAGLAAEACDAGVAAAGVDEWLELGRERWFRSDDGLVGSIHLHATDDPPEGDPPGPGEWFVAVTAGGLEWVHGHHKGDVAARGSRSDLFLALWQRPTSEPLDLVGDADLFGRFVAAGAV